MLNSLWAVIHDGKIELTEPAELPDGATVLVTILPPGDETFWQQASQGSLSSVWDNTEDDVYPQLLAS
ncbi:MAG TPA: hypothetical protein VGY55_23530 [Pirellulales bacterium]|jgi:hypothetical protein|nr:hypothetical protein [Pirellulales bacterium]